MIFLGFTVAVLASVSGGVYLGWHLATVAERARWVAQVRAHAKNCETDREFVKELRRLATHVEDGGWS